ncbi:lysine exporter LysO family protein [Halosquirtibacter xylanolyticus]|uniref:lysine exporter LysO family protein n=1 Tax=Halosquirtibacter xylanolyticus TaxID=3374599 RepID=UPI003747CFAA|nr:lysine exporter LysO family protein [Prolixibacteraceae bacterium]
MKGSVIILCFFALGAILGVYDLLPLEHVPVDNVSEYVLMSLLFVVGIGVGADSSSWDLIKSMNYKILMVPILIAIGSIIGAALVSFALPNISFADGAAVGSGLGYYSLSSILITKANGEMLGTIALLSNIIRELTTLILVPFYVRYFGRFAGIASGGATSMDTTLPIITKYSGKEIAVISVFNGIVLTLLVPVLVYFSLSILPIIVKLSTDLFG